MLITNDEAEYETLRFTFDITNDEAEYVALCAELRIADSLQVQNLAIFSDSQIIVN